MFNKKTHKARSIFVLSVLPILGLLILAKPKVSNADFISLFSSAFKNKDIKYAEEIEQVNKSSQNMVILHATINPQSSFSQSATSSNAKMANNKAILASSSTDNLNMVDGAVLVSDKKVAVNSAVDADGYINDRISLYTVHSGDTLEQIAKMYSVTPSTILWANDLTKGTALKEGQVLVILPISGIKYTVKKGDTLEKIATKYKGDKVEIALFNNMSAGDSLNVGDEIIIPDADGSLAASQTTTKNTKTSTKSSGKDSSGYFMRPVVGGVRTQGIHGHNGIDIAASLGTPILAAADGTVVISKFGSWNGGYGNYVVIQHSNGTQTLYGHMSANLVSAGEKVTKGQAIGKMGNSGQSTGVHLHFEVRGGKNPF